VKTLLLSDIHANIDAVLAVEEDLHRRQEHWDLVLVLGDLVDYGPAPDEVIAWVRGHAHHAVRGNHDHAMATGADCRSSPAYKELSVATRAFFRPRLEPASLAFLQALPTRLSVNIDGRTALMVHATPRNPLFEYLGPDAPHKAWAAAIGVLAEDSDYVFLGHTHLPFVRRVGKATVVNPGSLGQPKDGDPRGCYAVLEDDRVELRRVAYDVERAVARLSGLGLDIRHAQTLAGILRSGGLSAA
jgi:predicted phosphodiesterase